MPDDLASPLENLALSTSSLVAVAASRNRGDRGTPRGVLFGASDIELPSRYWLHYHCARLCKAARVPVVPPHGLRGTHATIAMGAVATSHSVQAALAAAGGSLGHAPGSPLTETTYVAPGAVDKARQRVVMRVIDGGRR